MRKFLYLLPLALLLMAFTSYDSGMEGPPYVASTALEGSHVLKAHPGNLYTITVVWHTQAARWLMLFDATAAPADGAVTPAWCAPISSSTDPADGFKALDFTTHAPFFAKGIVAVVSTNTSGCFSKTVDGASDAFFGQVQ